MEQNTDVQTDGQENGQKQGKSRSGTSYPYYGLPKAIEIVEAVRRAGGNDPAPNADVMREMGITKTTDRQWAYGIPAATQFGLIERVGRGNDGQIRLTELGTRVALPENEEERRSAKIAAFKTPELYAKLWERFAGHPAPAREGLKNILLRQFEIVESMTSNAADAFLESLGEAGLLTPSNEVSASGNAPENEPDGETKPPKEEPAPGTQTIEVPSDFIVYRCKLGGGRVIEVPLPPDFTTKDVKRLHAFLRTQVDDPDELEAGSDEFQ